MEFVENIGFEEYEKFVSKHIKSHFMQSYYFGDVMKYKNYTPYYVGLKKDGELVATALLLKKSLIMGFCYYYSPRGFVLDYNNLSILNEFTKCLKLYAKKNRAIFIKMDPDIKRHDLDLDGNILGNDNNLLIAHLKKLGYKHTGFNTAFVNEQPRFTFRLDLDRSFDEVYSGFHSTTRKILNKKNEYELDIYKGNVEDIDEFYFTMKETALRENLGCQPISYYENFYKILSENNMSDLYVSKVRINNLLSIYEEKIKNIDIKIQEESNKSSKKSINKVSELNNEKTKVIREYEEIKTITDEEIVLSSILTVKYNDMVWTVHGGNSTQLRNLNSNYLLYYTIIKDAYDQGYKKIDFFGTSGIANPPKTDPIYGIHNFKRRLGGEYTEFIGEFDLICNGLMYNLFKILIPIRRKITKYKLRRKNNV